ncbi:Outer membrane scaffolding protein for murein synthesis, MipA/OmpV family [Cognatiyoonia koreensis]|uniref:Outer membrane scaffolding protein for murein synthesis, MipA/OmpV family n=1 Tax=Cognatiyoonia koreensis TaxID=364200 RepID=A0A1I0Q7C8_9RHOB|nr:MipA/OmpV family protein [Cognatiyoonia koreensis]SEW22486.1 Outer membrane scaffolding protein for murein synthesis, MipA/OmpV family [Cognatiyoonia koreensis]
MRLAPLLAILATPAFGQADSGNELSFDLGLGAQSGPAYFGSDETVIGPTGSFALDRFAFGSVVIGDGDPNGIGFKGGFRYIGERSGDDYDELLGLNDIDAALELGGGITYTDLPTGHGDWGTLTYAEVRYGVIGHEAWVAEIGSDLIYTPTDDLTLTLGPRLFGGTDDYAETYFGVSPDEAASSSYDAFAATGGVLSRGLEASASYDFNEDWGVTGTITYEEFLNDAANSPIVQQGSSDQLNVSLVVTRSISFNF